MGEEQNLANETCLSLCSRGCTPQQKPIAFFVATLSGYLHLKDISLRLTRWIRT
jgi:hypothetical protein